MDEIQEQIDGIEEDAETVKDLYALVDQYQVPVNPEDLAVYQVLCSVLMIIFNIVAIIYYSSRAFDLKSVACAVL